jgi:hypothetical protein
MAPVKSGGRTLGSGTADSVHNVAKGTRTLTPSPKQWACLVCTLYVPKQLASVLAGSYQYSTGAMMQNTLLVQSAPHLGGMNFVPSDDEDPRYWQYMALTV